MTSTSTPLICEQDVSFGGFSRCVRLSNGRIELIATTEVGPHVLRFGFVGGGNVFHDYALGGVQLDPAHWHNYGGHRLWVAPEIEAITYAPANEPIQVDWDGRSLRLEAPVEKTGIAKVITLRMSPAGEHVEVVHEVYNRGATAIELAPWVLSVMATGGRAIFPQEPFVAHPAKLTPARPLVLWNFTDMADPRWTWGTKYVQLQQDPGNTKKQKVGLLNTVGWAAYAVHGELFIKRYGYDPGATYADYGCNTETYTDADMLELETLGALVTLAPDAGTTHVEHWYMAAVTLPDASEEAIDRLVLPIAQHTERYTL